MNTYLSRMLSNLSDDYEYYQANKEERNNIIENENY